MPTLFPALEVPPDGGTVMLNKRIWYQRHADHFTEQVQATAA